MTRADTVDQRQFRNALGAFTTGVTIVTTKDGNGRDIGLTVSSFNSVSLDPPMVLWSLGRNSASLPAFLQATHFAVHVLASDQEALSSRFATKGAEKFAGIAVQRGQEDLPLLDGCAARFECKTAFRYDGGDHEIFVGEVINFEHFDRLPLVFQGGNYAKLLKKPAAIGKPGREPENDSSFSRNSLSYLCGVATHYLNEKLVKELTRAGLSQFDFWVLNLLANKEGQTIAELDIQMGPSRLRVTPEVIDRLINCGLVAETSGHGAERRLRLTGKGREELIAFVVAAKATEENAQKGLDQAEEQLLRQLLKRVIREMVESHS